MAQSLYWVKYLDRMSFINELCLKLYRSFMKWNVWIVFTWNCIKYFIREKNKKILVSEYHSAVRRWSRIYLRWGWGWPIKTDTAETLSAKLRILSAAENRHLRKFTSLRWKGELSPLSPLFESTPVCYTVGIEWVIVMDVLNLNSIRYVNT
jgi:hypothetical protein